MTPISPQTTPAPPPSFTDEDARILRDRFPILRRRINENPLIYLDSAATTQKPRLVIDAVQRFYERSNANVHRGVHTLSQEATAAFESARDTVRRSLNAAETREIVFTRGVTESINLVAHAWARSNLKPGDEILLTRMEHHANIVPWQVAAEHTGATIRVAPIDDRGSLILEELETLITPRTRLVAATHVSNTLGTVNPVKHITRLAHAAGALVLIDGAQALAHRATDVRDIGCDFYCVSAHKAFGPTGVGALYARADILEAMPPYQTGGEMIRSVSFDRTTYNDIPTRFEAGTPNIAGAVGFAAALDFIRENLPRQRAGPYEQRLLQHLTESVRAVPGTRLIGAAPDKAPILSFSIDGVHPHDIGSFLDAEGIAVRTGQHCTEPLMDFFGVPATVRVSLAAHNTPDEIDALARALNTAVQFFR